MSFQSSTAERGSTPRPEAVAAEVSQTRACDDRRDQHLWEVECHTIGDGAVQDGLVSYVAALEPALPAAWVRR